MSRTPKLLIVAGLTTVLALPVMACGSGSSGGNPSDGLARTLTQPINRAQDAASQANQAQNDLQNSADQIAP